MRDDIYVTQLQSFMYIQYLQYCISMTTSWSDCQIERKLRTDIHFHIKKNQLN